MNLTKLFKTLLALLFLVGVVNAQTFYVNNLTGNDANPGTAALPKATVSSALLAAPGGSTISVAATGVNYAEATPGMNLLPGPLTPGVTGTYTFTSTGGTPVFTNQFQVGTAVTAGTITFSGPFQFNGLYLKNGTLANGNQITITGGGVVTRTEIGSITAGQLAFAGTAAFNYIDEVAAASNIVLGLEFPTATNVATNLTLTATVANLTVTLDQNRTINGILNTDGDAGANTGTLALSTFTLAINGANAHTIDGNVTGTGMLSFSVTGAASLDGLNAPRSITNLSVTSANGSTLTIDPAGASTISTVGNVDVNGSANLTMQNTGNIGNMTHNGSGTVTTAQTSPGTIGNVLMSSTATSTAIMYFNTAGAGGTMNTGTLTQSGQGVIGFGANVTVAVNTGNVALNTTFAFTTTAAQANRGRIIFDNLAAPPGLAAGGGLGNVGITGTLKNEAVFSGSIDDAGNTNNGIILFANTGNVNVTGLTTVNVTGTVTITAPGTVLTGGNIDFSAATGTGTFAGITNTSTVSMGTVMGTIYTSAGAATFAAGFTLGAVSSSSLNDGTAGRGDIEFQDVTAATINASSLTQNAVALGGDILLGNSNLTVTGNISNARTVAGAIIQWGTAGGAGTLSVQSIINSGAANIVFTRTVAGAVTINANVQQTGTGTISFPNAAAATIAMVGWTVSAGTFNIAGASATGNVTVTGPAVLSGGTVDLGNGVRAVIMSNSAIQIGGAGNVTFLNTGGATCNTEFRFTQPIPNVTQNITIGGLNQVFPGWINVNNVSAIPAPYVIFQSLNGSTGNPGNLYITNTGGAADGLVFNSTFGGVINTVRLDNARLYIGLNNPGGVAGGGFQNTTGYTTINGGFVMMNGNAAQVVNTLAPAAGATFGNFGVDNNGGVAVTFGAATCIFTAEFYLAEGPVNFTNAQFNGTAPWPTVYRTEGNFTTVPGVAGGTFINVTYYGNDKATANETGVGVPIWNITVATTNGANPGKGIVSLGGNVTVNGTLTINADQSFYTVANTLTLNGASAVVNGYLVDDGTTRVQLAAATGTTFSGSGWLPGIQVNAGSTNNTIAGRGLVSNGFGGDNVWGGGNDDFNTMDASINYAGGAASSLTATFLAPTAPSTTNFFNLTTAAGATFTLGANAIMGGNMTHAAGAIVLGDFTLDHQGVAPGMTGGATITSNAAGRLFFQTGNPVFTVTAPAGTIGANVEFSGDTQTWTLNNAGADLTINGNLTLTDKSAAAGGATVDIGAGRILTAGANITVNANCAFTATAGGTTGVLRINPVVAPSTWSTPANSSVTNLTVDGSVNLTGGIAGSTLTVGQAAAGVFIHNAGEINIGTANLQIGNANATNFNRTGATATYSGSGYMIWNSIGAFNHSTVVAAGAMTINKFRTLLNLALVNGRGLTVVQNLDVLNSSVFTNSVAGVGYLTVGDATTVPVITLGENAAGDPNIATNAPTFGNADVDYIFTDAAGAGNGFTVTTTAWPTAQAARNVTVNMAVGATDVLLGANRTITTALNLTEGRLVWDSPTAVTLNSGVLITRDQNSSMTRDLSGAAPVGTLNAVLVDLRYTNNVGNTGEEYSLPTEVRNFTLGLPAGTAVAINSSRTITGTITWNSALTFNAATVTNITLAQTLPGTSTVTVAATAVVNWNGGLTVNSTAAGAYTNNGTTVVVGTLAGSGNITNNNIFTLGGLNLTAGLLTLGGGSATTLTGDATINGLTVPAQAGGVFATISTANNLTFANVAWTNTGLNLTFTGTNNQTVALGQNRGLQNWNMTKGNDGTVTVSGGNVTLNAAIAGPPAVAAGALTLTRGVLVVGNIVAGTPALFTIQVTTNGGAPAIITNLGYVRNPANNVDLAHVVGRLGVFIPVNTLGRMEWPVGSATKYRPAAITFTAGNFTIAPTTVIASHVESAPILAGESRPEFPLDGGTKVAGGANWIGSAVPYYWLFEATTSLGAAQLFNVELNATELTGLFPSLGNRNHNDLRIIRRFFGNVSANRWYIEGSNSTYTNALYENTPVTGAWLAVVRNIGSMGSAISQQAMFTVGLPSQAPIWAVGGNVAGAITEATGTTLNTYTTTQTATDPDVAAATVTYSVQSVTPAVPSDATYAISSAGVFTFTPGWNGGTAAGRAYTFVIRASKNATDFTEKNIVVTVTNTNRVPSFTATGGVGLTNETVKYGTAYSKVVNAVDADGETLTYALVSAVPALVTAPVVNASGQLSFTPVYADLGKAVVITISATDPSGGVATTNATFTVAAAYKRGDANLSGSEPDVTDAIQILEYVVGKRTFTDEQKSYANADLSAEVPTNPTAYDASFILRYIAAGYVWPTSKAVATAGLVEFGKLVPENGSYFLPFNLTNTKGVTSVQAEVNVGGNVDINAVTSRLPQDWLVITSNENGVVRIAAAGVTPLNDGAFATLEMKLKNKEAVVNVQGSAILNDELSASLNAKVREIPSEFALSQNYPNPFNPTTTIKYAVATDVNVSLVVYDMLGQVVKTLVNGNQEAGFYSVKWDGTNEYGSRIASGIYIYRLQAGNFVSTVKMNLMK